MPRHSVLTRLTVAGAALVFAMAALLAPVSHAACAYHAGQGHAGSSPVATHASAHLAMGSSTNEHGTPDAPDGSDHGQDCTASCCCSLSAPQPVAATPSPSAGPPVRAAGVATSATTSPRRLASHFLPFANAPPHHA